MRMPDTPRPALLLARIVVVFSGALLCLRATALATTDAAPSSNAPNGLVVVIENKPRAASLDLRALNNPSISGVALQIRWRDIEPVEGKPDWKKLDELFAGAESSKKWVHLIIFPGFFTPPWALEGVKTETFAIQYGPGAGTVEPLPMPWDKVYLDRWFTFLKQVSERYRKSPAFRMIAAAGPTSVSAEFTLPNSPQDLKKWQSLSYRPSKYLEAWRQVLDVYATDFPNQYVSLSLGGGPNINEQGKRDPQQHLHTRQAMVDQAIARLGRRLVLQMSDIHAGPGPHVSSSEAEDKYVIDYIGRVTTGFQMRTSAEHGSPVMGAAGDPPLALERSMDLALKTNSAAQHVNYVEIYEPDVLANEMQPVLRQAAAKFPHD